MTPDDLQQLKMLFVATAMYYGHDIPDAVLQLYVADLADLNFQEVAHAIQNLRRDPKTTKCPLPAQVRARVVPESNPDSHAVLIANEILWAVSRCGPYQTPKLSPVAQQVVRMEGGWQQVCIAVESNDAIPNFKAQWRNLAKAIITEPRSSHTPRPALVDNSGGGLKSLGDVFKQIEDKKGSGNES